MHGDTCALPPLAFSTATPRDPKCPAVLGPMESVSAFEPLAERFRGRVRTRGGEGGTFHETSVQRD